jgi:hypothetical protein
MLISDQTTNIYVLLGNGDGTFQTPQTYSLTAGPGYTNDAPILADFNGDGHLDIAAPFGCCTVGVTGIDILFGNGGGSFLLGAPILLSPGPMVGGDFNGDGKPDLAFSNPFSNEISIVLNR